jgi:hypothetical protein
VIFFQLTNKGFFMKNIPLAISLIVGMEAYAQNNEWIYIKDYEGISISWRWRQELKDQYISELKFDNNNSYKVDITFIPHFVCADGTDHIETGMTHTIAPGGKKGGQWDGLFFYPCKGIRPPRYGGYKNLIVKRADDKGHANHENQNSNNTINRSDQQNTNRNLEQTKQIEIDFSDASIEELNDKLLELNNNLNQDPANSNKYVPILKALLNQLIKLYKNDPDMAPLVPTLEQQLLLINQLDE